MLTDAQTDIKLDVMLKQARQRYGLCLLGTAKLSGLPAASGAELPVTWQGFRMECVQSLVKAQQSEKAHS